LCNGFRKEKKKKVGVIPSTKKWVAESREKGRKKVLHQGKGDSYISSRGGDPNSRVIGKKRREKTWIPNGFFRRPKKRECPVLIF